MLQKEPTLKELAPVVPSRPRMGPNGPLSVRLPLYDDRRPEDHIGSQVPMHDVLTVSMLEVVRFVLGSFLIVRFLDPSRLLCVSDSLQGPPLDFVKEVLQGLLSGRVRGILSNGSIQALM